MKKLSIPLVVFLSITISCISCKKDSNEMVVFNGESYNADNGLNDSETALYDDLFLVLVIMPTREKWYAIQLK